MLPPAVELAGGVGSYQAFPSEGNARGREAQQNVAFYVDERLIKLVQQSSAYPMQFMLKIAVCAYFIWEQEGKPVGRVGRALDHWLQVEL
jgi:hypothetical protein